MSDLADVNLALLQDRLALAEIRNVVLRHMVDNPGGANRANADELMARTDQIDTRMGEAQSYLEIREHVQAEIQAARASARAL